MPVALVNKKDSLQHLRVQCAREFSSIRLNVVPYAINISTTDL